MEGASSFKDARQACIKDSTCKGFFDVDCDGFMFWICRGTFQLWFLDTEVYKTCAWEKGKTN